MGDEARAQGACSTWLDVGVTRTHRFGGTWLRGGGEQRRNRGIAPRRSANEGGAHADHAVHQSPREYLTPVEVEMLIATEDAREVRAPRRDNDPDRLSPRAA